MDDRGDQRDEHEPDPAVHVHPFRANKRFQVDSPRRAPRLLVSLFISARDEPASYARRSQASRPSTTKVTP